MLETASVEVVDERRQRGVEHRHVFTATFEVIAMPIPPTEVQGYHASAGFD